jgi:hypothetical protein
MSGFPGVTAVENFAGTNVAFGPQGTTTGGGQNLMVTSSDGKKTVTVQLGATGNPRIQ